MRGLLVPVDLDTPVSVVEHDGTFATMYPLVGTDMLESPTMPVMADNGHAVYIDEEAALKADSQVNWRLSAAYPAVRYGSLLYGAGVIVSQEPDGIVDMAEVEVWCERYGAALDRAAGRLQAMLTAP